MQPKVELPIIIFNQLHWVPLAMSSANMRTRFDLNDLGPVNLIKTNKGIGIVSDSVVITEPLLVTPLSTEK